MHLQQANTSDWLSSSWHRSTEAGLKQRRLPEDIRLPQSILKQRRHQSSSLIQIVERNALPLFNQMFARTDSRLILTDIEGVILASWGQERFREKLTSIALSSGACWQEQLKGTNAIGTAIIEGLLQKPHETPDFNCDSSLSNTLWSSLNSNGDISPPNLSYGV